MLNRAWRRFAVFALCILSCGPAGSQVPKFTIFPEAKQAIHGTSDGISTLGLPQCGGEGSYIYLRQFHPTFNPYVRPKMGPIVRLTAANGEFQFFNASAIPGLADANKFQVVDFAVSGSDVYMLGYVPQKKAVSIVHFASSGNPEGTIKIERSMFEPMRILRFDSGNFLIASSTMKQTDFANGDHRMAFSGSLGLYDASGKFIKDIVLSEAKEQKPKGSKEELLVDHRGTLSLAAMVSDNDRAYIVPRTDGNADPRVYTINPAGEVTHIKLTSTLEGATVGSIRVSAGRIFVQYFTHSENKNESDEVLYAEYDLVSGEQLAQYFPAPDFQVNFACFDWRNTFVGIDGNEIVTGVAR